MPGPTIREALRSSTQEGINNTTSKSFTQLSQQQVFDTTPKISIRRGRTITLRRCQEVMKNLWQRGYRTICEHEQIKSAVFFCVGQDYRTLRAYAGYNRTIKKARKFSPALTVWEKGYLEKLRYIRRSKNAQWLLFHEVVPLTYHNEQTRLLFPPAPPHHNKNEYITVKEATTERIESREKPVTLEKHSKDVLCVYNTGDATLGSNGNNGNNGNNNNSDTHTKQLSESIPELTAEEKRVLDVASGRDIQ